MELIRYRLILVLFGVMTTPAVLWGCLPEASSTGSEMPPRDVSHTPQVRVNERTVRYDVGGRTVPEVGQFFAMRGPVSEGGRYFGLTESKMDVVYAGLTENGRCELVNVRVALDVTIHLPQLEELNEATPEVRRAWPHLMQPLRRHEDNHRNIAVEGARRLAEALGTLSGSAPCDTVMKRAEAVTQRISRETEAAQRRYDKRTAHGRKEGVAWPPR